MWAYVEDAAKTTGRSVSEELEFRVELAMEGDRLGNIASMIHDGLAAVSDKLVAISARIDAMDAARREESGRLLRIIEGLMQTRAQS
jgi:hypothetical protein